jgi:NitT/TauT family transport system substrate-binding protein
MKRATFAATAAAAACSVPAIALGQTRVSMRIGTYPADSFGLVIYAKEMGFFEANGIDAQVEYAASNSSGLTAALVGGELEATCSSMGPISNASLRGIPIRLIAPGGIIASESSTTACVVLKTSPIFSARDLNGKTVATSALKDVIHVALAKWIDVNGGDSKSVKFVEIPVPDLPLALQSGRIDGCSLSEPLLTNTRDEFRALGHIYDAISHRMMITMHIVMQEWLDKNPDTARRLILAMRQAARWANTNHAASATIVARVTKIPLEVVVKMNRVIYAETLDLATIQPQVDVLADYKFIDRRYNVADLVWPPPH